MTMGTGGHKAFVWKRTGHSEDNKHSWSSWKLVDETTGTDVAAYLNNGLKSWKKLGKFQYLGDHGKNWELMVLLTGLGIIDRARRRKRA
jgi:hypothetical protein